LTGHDATHPAGRTRAADEEERLAELVGLYSRRVAPAVLAQHQGASVSSALGVWLLLAACASASEGEDRLALEDALGCTADEAHKLLAKFMASAPPALVSALAVWVSVSDATTQLAGWARGLPPEVESGYMPTQAEADEWARKHTLGLIKSFPISLNAVRVVLASALATKVSWPIPYDLVAADEHLAETSPWHGKVKQLLWDASPGRVAMLTQTNAAGLVAVHQARAEEELTVISVSGDPDVSPEAVLDAACELAEFARRDDAPDPVSLFDLPLGAGHSWEITERETKTLRPGERVERIVGASLPAWQIDSTLNLLASDRFGSQAALDTVRRLIGPHPDDAFDAQQAATASFTRYGFEAAAVTAFAIPLSARREPDQPGVERTAVLRFDHPYAAVAMSGQPLRRPLSGEMRRHNLGFSGLPLFSAWVHEPTEALSDP
jgi:hypothetical protein